MNEERRYWGVYGAGCRPEGQGGCDKEEVPCFGEVQGMDQGSQ